MTQFETKIHLPLSQFRYPTSSLYRALRVGVGTPWPLIQYGWREACPRKQ